MEKCRGNIVFLYRNAFLHLEFAIIDAFNGISLVYIETSMVGLDVSLITQRNYACTTQDKLWMQKWLSSLRKMPSLNYGLE